MSTDLYDLVVIGAGPGGEVGAIRAAQLGLKVAVVEKNTHLGGTCLNVGCIPTKSLLESAKTWTKLQHCKELGFSLENLSYSWEKIMARKEQIVDTQRKGLKFLMKKNKIDVHQGVGCFLSKEKIEVTDASGKKTTLQTKNTLIATGSKVKEFPLAKVDGKRVHSSDTILFIDAVPKSLAIIGGGVVGVEFASLFGRFGTQVSVYERIEQILPFEDPESAKELSRYLGKQNITFHLGVSLKSIEPLKDKVKITVEGKEPEEFTHVLIATGRSPVYEELNLAKIAVLVEKGFIKVDTHYRTSTPGIYAIGDVIATPALAHTASAEAIHAVEVIANKSPHPINYETNPSSIYTYPEVASIGKTEPQLKSAGIEYKSAKFPFAPLAKAKIEDATEGYIKILSDPKYGELLGVHIVGARACELISEFALGKNLETTLEEIANTIHPHPTIAETVMEAAHAALSGAIHM